MQKPNFKRQDTWFSLYFVPLFRVRKGHLISVVCSNCNSPMQLSNYGAAQQAQAQEQTQALTPSDVHNKI